MNSLCTAVDGEDEGGAGDADLIKAQAKVGPACISDFIYIAVYLCLMGPALHIVAAYIWAGETSDPRQGQAARESHRQC